MADPPDLEELIERATNGLDAAQRLEDRVGGELDRRFLLSQLTLLDRGRGQPLRLELGGGASITSTQGTDLGGGLTDAALAREYRWALAKAIDAYTGGHFGIAVDGGIVRAVPADAVGAAWLRIADRLIRGLPRAAVMRPRRSCAWCGKEFVSQRSTARYCSNAHKQAMLQARRRAREESTQ
jgi:hypothetical protein